MSGLTLKQRLAFELQRQLIKDQAEKHPLRQLFWECTLRCNMRCRHCGSDCKTSALHPDMPFEDFEKVLLRIKEKYDSHKVMIVITGGEPLPECNGGNTDSGRRTDNQIRCCHLCKQQKLRKPEGIQGLSHLSRIEELEAVYRLPCRSCSPGSGTSIEQ